MLKRIIVRSRADAERQVKEFFSPAFAVISITDPGYPEARVDGHNCCTGVLRLKFDDIDPPRWEPRDWDDKTVMHDGHASRTWEFVRDQWLKIDTLLIHCEAGVSRSPSLAMAIADVHALGRDAIDWERDVNRDPPNGHVYDTLVKWFPKLVLAE